MQQTNPSNPFNTIDQSDPYSTTRRFISCLCLLLGGGLLAQLLSIIVVRIASSDIQAGGIKSTHLTVG